MQIEKSLKKVSSSTRIFFGFALLANVTIFLQLFSLDFLPLGDWIPHIYNSRIVSDLIFNPGTGIERYYEMCFSHLTNITDHFLMATFMTILPATIASQILVAMVVLVMQFGLYRLLKVLGINLWWTFLIIPFIFNSLFIGGMMNFNIAIGLMFLLLAEWIRFFKDGDSTGLLVILLIIPILIYITHIFIYGIAGLVCGILLLTIVFKDSVYQFSEIFKRGKLRKALIVFLGSNMVPAFLFLKYFFESTSVSSSVSSTNISFQPIRNLLSMRVLVGYSGAAEGHSLNLLYISLAVITVVCILMIFLPGFRKVINANTLGGDSLSFQWQRRFLITMTIVSCIFLTGLFLIPAKVAGAGASLDKRMELLLTFTIVVILILLVSRFRYEHFLMLLIVPVFISAVLHNNVLKRFWERDSYYVGYHLMELSDQWPELSTAMVVSRDTKWYMAHIGNAVGMQNRVISYENYEAESGHFLTKRVEGSYLNQIDKNSRFFAYNQVNWEIIIPDYEPDYLILLHKENPITIPGELYSRYDTISNEKAGDFNVIEMKRRP